MAACGGAKNVTSSSLSVVGVATHALSKDTCQRRLPVEMGNLLMATCLLENCCCLDLIGKFSVPGLMSNPQRAHCIGTLHLRRLLAAQRCWDAVPQGTAHMKLRLHA